MQSAIEKTAIQQLLAMTSANTTQAAQIIQTPRKNLIPALTAINHTTGAIIVGAGEIHPVLEVEPVQY
jgi:DNA-binding NtrC family response regulator